MQGNSNGNSDHSTLAHCSNWLQDPIHLKMIREHEELLASKRKIYFLDEEGIAGTELKEAVDSLFISESDDSIIRLLRAFKRKKMGQEYHHLARDIIKPFRTDFEQREQRVQTYFTQVNTKVHEQRLEVSNTAVDAMATVPAMYTNPKDPIVECLTGKYGLTGNWLAKRRYEVFRDRENFLVLIHVRDGKRKIYKIVTINEFTGESRLWVLRSRKT